MTIPNLEPVPVFKTSRGAADVHSAIAAHLQATLPEFIDQARIDWDRTEYELPYPRRYGAYNPKQIDEYPAIVTIVTRDSNWVRTDLDRQMGLEYSTDWDVKLYIWIHSPENEIYEFVEPIYETTLQLRDDMATLTRAALLLMPSIGDESRFKVHEDGFTSDYLEILPAGEGRPDYMTISTLSFTVTSRETVARKPLGVVEFIATEVEPLPYEVLTAYVP